MMEMRGSRFKWRVLLLLSLQRRGLRVSAEGMRSRWWWFISWPTNDAATNPAALVLGAVDTAGAVLWGGAGASASVLGKNCWTLLAQVGVMSASG